MAKQVAHLATLKEPTHSIGFHSLFKVGLSTHTYFSYLEVAYNLIGQVC